MRGGEISMAERYFVMRHGTSEANLSGKVQGQRDIPLADVGKEQAERAGEALRGLGIEKIYSSPLQRALQTALIVAEKLKVDVSILPGLTARNLGEWSNMDSSELKKMLRDPNHPINTDPQFAPPGGETLKQLRDRIWGALEEVLKLNQTPLFVTHLTPARLLIQRYSDESPLLKNTEVWRVNIPEKKAESVYSPTEKALPGYE